MTIRVVVGPPFGGKSTYVRDHAKAADVVVDFDAIALALGTTGEPPDDTSTIWLVAQAARRGAIAAILEGVDGSAWIIHTNPDAARIRVYADAGATFVMVDPGQDVCEQRARDEDASASAFAAIADWYADPPIIPEKNAGGPLMARTMPHEDSAVLMADAVFGAVTAYVGKAVAGVIAQIETMASQAEAGNLAIHLRIDEVAVAASEDAATLRDTAATLRQENADLAATVQRQADRIAMLETREAVPGPVGPPGNDGAPGAPGEPGEPGPEGPAGPAGRDGADGVAGVIGPPGEQGMPGDRGEPGPEGPAGPVGPAGADGKDGATGAPGVAGERGADGSVGVAGRDGRDGPHGAPGEAGRDGIDGMNGKDGRDGIRPDDIDVQAMDGGRVIVFSFDAEDIRMSHECVLDVPIHREVFDPEREYLKGDVVTNGGSWWICNATTRDKPGEGNPAWTLTVKRGRDGKDGKPGERGLPGPTGKDGRDLTQRGPDGSKW